MISKVGTRLDLERDMTITEFLSAAADSRRRLPHLPESEPPRLMLCDGAADPPACLTGDAAAQEVCSTCKGSG